MNFIMTDKEKIQGLIKMGMLLADAIKIVEADKRIQEKTKAILELLT